MIERDELLKMARETNHKNGGSEFVAMNSGMLGKFANAILERAALECDDHSETYANTATKMEDDGDDAHSVWAMATAAKFAGVKIRALKTKE